MRTSASRSPSPRAANDVRRKAARRGISRVALLAAATVLSAAASLSAASSASAHDALSQTDPADGATLASLPAEITLTFTGQLLAEDGATQIQVTDAAGTSLASGSPLVSGTRAVQPLVPGDTASVPGTVTVLWRVVSSDGHPISGQFAFTVPPGASTPSPAATTSTPPAGDPTPADSSSSTPPPLVAEDPLMNAIDMRPWLIGGGVLAAAAAGAMVYLLLRRARSGPGSEDVSDR